MMIDKLLKKASDLHSEAYRLEAECPHKIFSHGSFGYAACEGCNRDFGWYCPDSPDHVCHYFIEDGMLELIDGTLIKAPEGAEEQYDICLFCGHPEERK